MLLEEFDVKKYERTLRGEGREEGREEGRKDGREEGIQLTVEILQELGQSRECAKGKLEEKYFMTEPEAEQKLLRYWK